MGSGNWNNALNNIVFKINIALGNPHSARIITQFANVTKPRSKKEKRPSSDKTDDR